MAFRPYGYASARDDTVVPGRASGRRGLIEYEERPAHEETGGA